ncbi:MAG: tRNA uridine-5-carboxymethylaminomethyl(34) synthesis GTPase MnmE, partial [Endomicrobiia bacterium]
MKNYEDTIVAISTPVSGEGGIGIVRLSGSDSISIADKIFFSKNGKKPSEYQTHTVHYGWIKDEDKIIDEVLLTIMKAPKTYTREDIVEISGHGGPIVLRKILDLCLKNGARLARPGEFTERAFLNGRIDLLQAEAVCELIRSKTNHAASISANQLKGALSEKIKKIKEELINLISNIEVSLDYPEEDLEFISNEKIEDILKSSIKKIEDILKALKKGSIYKEGIKVCIIGKPNVGKSSLLNALLSDDRSIVSHIPGTTRDIVSETFCIKDIPVTLMDTAGIGLKKISEDEKYLQELSEEKTKNAISKSDIIIFIVDVSSEITDEDIKIADKLSEENKKTILVLNKIDIKTENIEKTLDRLKNYKFFDS